MNAFWIVPMRGCHWLLSNAHLKLCTPMQGTAADIIKRAMIAVDKWLPESGIAASMIMQVHDELIFEVDDADIDRLIGGIVQRMEAAASLDVPLVVDVGRGLNWDEAH